MDLSWISCFKCAATLSLDSEFENMRHPHKYSELLKKEARALQASKKDIEERISNCCHFLKLTNVAQTWMKDVEGLCSEVDELAVPGRNRSRQGYETKRALERAKALTKQRSSWVDSQIMIEIIEKREVEKIHHNPQQTVVGDFEGNLKKVQKYLTPGKIFAVEIQGAAGIGKTTMLKEINNKYFGAEDHGGFTVIVFVDMKETHGIGEIQTKIASRLGFDMVRFGEYDEDCRSKVLLNALSFERFLILLDEVREKVDFGKIGIPTECRIGRSKLVYATRKCKLCWGSFADGTVCIVKMEYLSERWSNMLFFQACDDMEKKALEEIGRKEIVEEILKRCHGLPLALVALGKASAECSNNSDALYDVLASFNRSRGEFFGKNLLEALKSSYEMLDDSDMKSCFLFCVLFGGYKDICTYRLVDYWIGEGLICKDDIQTLRGLRCSAQRRIEHLLADWLLDKGSKEKFIRIHEVVRGVAGWLATQGEETTQNNFKFLTAEKNVKPTTLIEMLRDVKRVSLEDSDVEDLLKLAPSCPHLFTLLMGLFLENGLQSELQERNLHYIKNRESNHLMGSSIVGWLKGTKMTDKKNWGEYCISNHFFSGTSTMHVLDLTRQPFLRLPTSLYSMESLHYLNLSYTWIEEIPEAFNKLRQLILLDLTGTMRLSHISPAAILPRSQLRSFKLYDSNYRRIDERGQISLECFEKSNLEELEIPLQNFDSVKRLSTSKQLSKWTTYLQLYDICDLNAESIFNGILPKLCELKTLSLKLCKFSDSLVTLRNHPCLASLMLEDINMSRIDLCCTDNEDMHLRKLHIRRCAQLRDLTCLTQLNHLQILEVGDCETIQELLPRTKKPHLQNLKLLTLDNLPQLKSLGGGGSSFNSVEKPSMTGCPKLRGIPPHLRGNNQI